MWLFFSKSYRNRYVFPYVSPKIRAKTQYLKGMRRTNGASNGGVDLLFHRSAFLALYIEFEPGSLWQHFSKKTLDKRRNRTSSSDESSTSPEAKKPRSGNTDLSEQTEEDDHDEILTALTMAEGLQETGN